MVTSELVVCWLSSMPFPGQVNATDMQHTKYVWDHLKDLVTATCDIYLRSTMYSGREKGAMKSQTTERISESKKKRKEEKRGD